MAMAAAGGVAAADALPAMLIACRGRLAEAADAEAAVKCSGLDWQRGVSGASTALPPDGDGWGRGESCRSEAEAEAAVIGAKAPACPQQITGESEDCRPLTVALRAALAGGKEAAAWEPCSAPAPPAAEAEGAAEVFLLFALVLTAAALLSWLFLPAVVAFAVFGQALSALLPGVLLPSGGLRALVMVALPPLYLAACVALLVSEAPPL